MKEILRLSVFLFMILAVIVLEWWIIPVILLFFPWVLKKTRNPRNGKFNIGYLVNYITDKMVA